MESSKMTRETRRANIIYFLNREGRIEHPHLIRVRHLCHSGVHLRDVKRWLSELRGKEMPDSFAWSYQRRYKTGMVWQDLMDDDLLTPISDCEYVLLGSLLPGAEFKSDLFPSPEVRSSPENEQLDAENGVLPDGVEEEKEEEQPRISSPAGNAGRRSQSTEAFALVT
ncbi:protein UPSTREAM OF FLC-like [Phalaenopsis equestris]|uniref:protein UPSTREAM OF FLC-like n=1 Tax=Phalaenopsis equestris TaxID=78828 RepID=UPI0009E444FF|nr:protein UPSTREAM OF FLC-like [Phalaenopsis equestris]